MEIYRNRLEDPEMKISRANTEKKPDYVAAVPPSPETSRQPVCETDIIVDLRKEFSEAVERTRADLQVSMVALRGEVQAADKNVQMLIHDLENSRDVFKKATDRCVNDLVGNEKGVSHSEHLSPMVEIVRQVQDSEGAEREAHQKLLGRIDELCNHLEAVEGAVSVELPHSVS